MTEERDTTERQPDRGATTSRVRELRDARGLPQQELAARARLTRQSVSAIEAGRAVPGVDVALRLAAVLGCSVEEMFGADPAPSVLATHAASERAGRSGDGRLAVGRVAGRWVSHRLGTEGSRISADALGGKDSETGREATLLRQVAELSDNLFVMGCATGLGLLMDRLNRGPGAGRFVWLPGSSTAALQALARREVHVAGVHLMDPKTGTANVVDTRRLVPELTLTLVTMARWEMGLVVSKGNPKRLRSGQDLARRGLRILAREPGSGARRLLEREIKAAGVAKDRMNALQEAQGHLEIARAIAMGAADVGIATRDVAITAGLDFVPLVEERYDLAFPAEELADPRVERLFNALTSSGYRQELSALGYDMSVAGERVPETPAG